MALKIHQILQCLHTFPVGEMQHRVAEFCYCVCLYKNTHSIKVAQKSTRVASTGNVFCSMQNSKTIDLYPLQHFHLHFYTTECFYVPVCEHKMFETCRKSKSHQPSQQLTPKLDSACGW